MKKHDPGLSDGRKEHLILCFDSLNKYLASTNLPHAKHYTRRLKTISKAIYSASEED